MRTSSRYLQETPVRSRRGPVPATSVRSQPRSGPSPPARSGAVDGLTRADGAVRLEGMLALRTSPAGYPMAPSVEEWAALSPAERVAVTDSLPGEVTYDEMAMPEGERHFEAKIRALDALRGYFRRHRRRIYLAAEMPTYYPAEPRFAPDLFAVLDASDQVRDKWVVSAEGKGLDWVLEVHVGGDRKKDAERNVARYARLGIPEYFLYDRERNRLAAYRLPAPDARVYTPIVPNHGLYESQVLGLEVRVAEDRLQFYWGTALVLESADLIAQLQEMYDQVQRRAEETEQLREAERQRAEAERARAEAAEQRAEAERARAEAAEQALARLREELARRSR
ncbi:MAG TPA: Uma2 family endonuclease [Kofleriaceae bacterium]|nr:Uma2 family endonuclease [Kofleriaceae bacterium]